MDEERICRMALSLIPGIGTITANRLIETVESAAWLFRHRGELADIEGMPSKLVKALDHPEILDRCEAEMKFAETNRIACLISSDPEYPARLRECPDAPLVLFYRGNVDLNRPRVISVVGTRRMTDYGRSLCTSLARELKAMAPDVIVVSGLAYGVDITMHLAALDNGLDTIGVLAHGLDRIYPSPHRATAAKMLEQGGLVTEFPSRTNPDKQNFVMRNRIIAGMADATVVVQSAKKGGALITASLASGYNRECFAVPGRVGDEYSEGCNWLIRSNQANLMECAEDLMNAMNWERAESASAKLPRQGELFPPADEEEAKVISLIKEQEEGMSLASLCVETGMKVNKLLAMLTSLEIRGLVRACAGGIYRSGWGA